jgi:hypothetical protein
MIYLPVDKKTKKHSNKSIARSRKLNRERLTVAWFQNGAKTFLCPTFLFS